MKLTHEEAASPLWAKLKKHLETEREALRSRNDADLNEIETTALRGRIKAIKEILLLERPANEEPDDAD